MKRPTLVQPLLTIMLCCAMTTVCAKKDLNLTASPSNTHATKAPNQGSTLKHPTPFAHIDARGPIKIKLHQKHGAPTLIHLSGPLKQRRTLHIIDDHNSLHLDLPEHSCKQPPCVTVSVQVPSLTGISLAGSAVLQGQMVQPEPLAIWLRDQSNVQIDGMIHLTHLRQRGESESTLAFINSPALNVHLHDHSHSKIGGRSGELTVKALQFSRLDAQFLRAKHNWIQSRDHAIVMAYPLNSLSAFAVNEGNIWVFNDDTNIISNTFSSGFGSVLALKP